MQVKKRIFAGAVCEQVVYQAEEGTRGISKKNPRPRFKNDEEREEHKRLISRRHFCLLVNENFGPTSIYSTLTFSQEYECHDFIEARFLIERFWRRIKYYYKEAKAVLVMGRGSGTKRIHVHMISDGIPIEELEKLWNYGSICEFSNLREHNFDRKTGKDLGRDYTGLANYLFDHWTQEQGNGKRYKGTSNLRQPEEEKATICMVQYSKEKPPKAPKGYVYTGDCIVTKYGYMRFHYVAIPEPRHKQRD